MERLKLIALDKEDLAIISAHCQDAVAKVGDLQFLATEGRFAIAMNRFAWEKGERSREFERRRAMLHFERVSGAQTQGLDRANPDQVLSLLAVTFEPGELPAGHIHLVFSGDAAIRLDVECIEAQLADMAAAWQTKSRPAHELG